MNHPIKESLACKTIDQLSRLIAQKEVSPVEVTESVIQRIHRYNGKLNAFISVNAEEAMIAARQAESEIASGKYRGSLHGIPVALKDIFYFKGETVTIGSKIHQDFVPGDDATVVAKLKDAGVIFAGKLNMHEYAWGGTTNNPHYGACHNPWKTECIPGGSSGGSGAAVAADMTIASLGTDTGGSIRIPASACGIVGLKPTHGRVSKYGCFPLAWTLDHIGPMVKTVRDAAIMLETIAGYDPKDPTSVNVPIPRYTSSLTEDLNGVVVGVNEDYFMENVDEQILIHVWNGIETLKRLGAEVKKVTIPALKYVAFAEMVTILSEASAIHHNQLKRRSQDYGDDVRRLLALGELVSAVDYLQAQQLRRRLGMEFVEVYQSVDVLVTPTLPFLPPPIGENEVTINGTKQSFLEHAIRFTAPGNLTGLPALSIPCGISNGLPVGMQIMGRAFDEGTVLRVAYAFEATKPLGDAKPVMS